MMTPHLARHTTSDAPSDPHAKSAARLLAVAEALSGIRDAMAAALVRAKQRYEMRKAIAELAALDDRTLKDMGVNRMNIKSLVHDNLSRRQ